MDGQIVVIANSVEQARCQMERACPERLPGALVISTHRPDIGLLMSALPLARDVIMTEGWERGAGAVAVRETLWRTLAKRGQGIGDVSWIEGDTLVTVDAH